MADKRIAEITLDESSIVRWNPDVDHEQKVAIYDLLEENYFALVDHDGFRAFICGEIVVFGLAMIAFTHGVVQLALPVAGRSRWSGLLLAVPFPLLFAVHFCVDNWLTKTVYKIIFFLHMARGELTPS